MSSFKIQWVNETIYVIVIDCLKHQLGCRGGMAYSVFDVRPVCRVSRQDSIALEGDNFFPIQLSLLKNYDLYLPWKYGLGCPLIYMEKKSFTVERNI